MQFKGRIFVVSGPSGAGKGTLVVKLMNRVPYLHLSVSATTRKPRPDEIPGVDYHFLSEEEFLKGVEEGKFLEWAKVHDCLYGTLYDEVKEFLAGGYDVVLEIDVQGALQVKERVPEAALIFISPPSWKELKARLEKRRTETKEAVERRIQNAKAEIKFADKYGYVIINDEVERAAERLVNIVKQERAKKKPTTM
ncbi:MAG: guanylate kinase [Actinomycetota bacterium]|nr:guanylate kinase [Actinomycetota bacterium]